MKWLKKLWQRLFHKPKPKISTWINDEDYEDELFDARYPGAREFHEDCGDR